MRPDFQFNYREPFIVNTRPKEVPLFSSWRRMRSAIESKATNILTYVKRSDEKYSRDSANIPLVESIKRRRRIAPRTKRQSTNLQMWTGRFRPEHNPD
jgi:hypothetical protein